ncbi:MAG: hypothetical protein ACP5O2_10940 [Bacteroidales bacterium]
MEEDEGLGQYDYLCVGDSTWVHWSTDWTVWATAEVEVSLPGASTNFPSEWKHDWGGRKHLSTIEQISPYHFPAAAYQPGYPISLNLKLNGNTLATYTNEAMLFGIEKQNVSGYIFNTTRQLVLQFAIDIGTVSGDRVLQGVHVKNVGSLKEGNGDKDIGYDGLKMYYEVGTSFDFDGTESSVNLWGDWGGDSKYNNEWKNLGLSITIPAGQKLYCYVVIENFSASVVLGRTAQFQLAVDGLWMDNYGLSHKNQARVDSKTNSDSLPLVEPTFHVPGVVVSSYYNAADPRDEWTELLVIADDLDLRGYTLRDNNSTQTSWQPEITFRNIDFWNHMRAGTIIKVWHRPASTSGNVYGAPDVSKADGYIELNLSDANYFSGGSFGTSPSWAGTSMNIAGSGDVVQLRDASGKHIHALGHINVAGADYNALPLPKLCHKVGLSSNQTLGICPGGNINEFGVFPPREDSVYTSVASGQQTPGLPNLCLSSSTENTIYWRSLRQPEWNSPSGFGSFNPGNTGVSLSWNACEDSYPADNTTGYLILRNTDNNFTPPVDGTTYLSGNTIGSAVVVAVIQNSQTTNYSDPTPAPCDGHFYYRIYAFRYAQDEMNGNSFHSARGAAYNETSFAEITVQGPISPNTSLIWHN